MLEPSLPHPDATAWGLLPADLWHSGGASIGPQEDPPSSPFLYANWASIAV